VILVADHSKVNRVSTALLAPLSSMNTFCNRFKSRQKIYSGIEKAKYQNCHCITERHAAENFRPQSKLVTKTTLVNKPKFPVIDAHDHLGEPFGGGWDKKPLERIA
jgi:hypothetical protein